MLVSMLAVCAAAVTLNEHSWLANSHPSFLWQPQAALQEASLHSLCSTTCVSCACPFLLTSSPHLRLHVCPSKTVQSCFACGYCTSCWRLHVLTMLLLVLQLCSRQVWHSLWHQPRIFFGGAVRAFDTQQGLVGPGPGASAPAESAAATSGGLCSRPGQSACRRSCWFTFCR